MGTASKMLATVRARWDDTRDGRRRRDLIARIGELTYAQRTDPAASYETEIERLVEDVRHLERVHELRQRQQIVDGD